MRISRSLWGKIINLDITYEIPIGEEISQVQDFALGNITDSWRIVEKSLPEVIKYCETQLGDSIENIHSTIILESLFIKRDKHKRIVVFLGKFKQTNNSIAIVFENEKFKTIGSQHIAI